jgi:hypothetical protein
MKRAHICMSLFFQPDEGDDIKMAIRQAFAKALSPYPEWAMHKAFDQWEKSSARRPTPAEIVIQAAREIKVLTDELRYRERASEAHRVPAPECAPMDATRADEILKMAGFTPKLIEAIRAEPMSITFAEAEERASTPLAPHWSEVAKPDAPEWSVLRASRAKNALMNPRPEGEDDE